MPIPEALILRSHDTLHAADLADLQVRMRGGVQGHVHGKDAPLLSAEVLDPRAAVRVRSVAAASASVGGEDLLALLDRNTEPMEIAGDLVLPGDLRVEGAIQIAGKASSPRVSVATTNPKVNPTFDDLSPAGGTGDKSRWRSIRDLKVDLHLSELSALLLTTAFTSADYPLVVRHGLEFEGVHLSALMAQALYSPGRFATAAAMAKWWRTVEPTTLTNWRRFFYQGAALKGGCLLEAVTLPPGDYTVTTELHWCEGTAISQSATLTVTQL